MKDFSNDIDNIVSHRHDLGFDYWTTTDNRIYKGNPFSTITSLLMLYELGLDRTHEAVQGGLDCLVKAIRPDGKIRIAPKSPLHPCYTAEAARVLSRYGFQTNSELAKTKEYLLSSSHESGGWRCSYSGFGKGPETEVANPGATLLVLDFLRFYPELRRDNPIIDAAIDFLLAHWESRKPLGPCHYGIGSQFLKIEFPFLKYNIFFYAYILSFYIKAKADNRFLSVVEELGRSVDKDGSLVIQNCHPRLRQYRFCRIGSASDISNKRYTEILANLNS